MVNIREIAFDRWGAVQMVQNLEGMGFTVVPFGQGFKDMSPPTKELMKLVLEKRIAHGGHPVLRWMMDNIYIRTDPAGNIKADKEKSTEKIDGAIAAIMALDRYSGAKVNIHKVDVDFVSPVGSLAVCRDGAGIPFDETLGKKILAEDEIT